jgi:ketosteroid isomerase-like protein
MYRMIVISKTRGVWRKIDQHDASAPWAMAAEDLRFQFVGDTAISADLRGRDQFRAWLEGVFERFDDVRFTVLDVAVKGWPWHTRVAVRLRVNATLADGSAYENFACQWITLRWGKMTEDWVLEDTALLQGALRVQSRGAAVGATSDAGERTP